MKKILLSIVLAATSFSQAFASMPTDHRYLLDVEPLTGCREMVNSLSPISYTFFYTPALGRYPGFVAHELNNALSAGSPPEPLFPPIVINPYVDAPRNDGFDTLQEVELELLIPIITCAIQEANADVVAANERIDDLENIENNLEGWAAQKNIEVSDLQSDVSALETTVAGLSSPPVATTSTSGLMSAADKLKLNGIASGATANDTDANLKARANHTGTQSADTITDGTTNKVFTAANQTKLSGIATGATANSSDATLLARANHTGTQAISTVTNLQTALDSKPTAKLAFLSGTTNASGDVTFSISGFTAPKCIAQIVASTTDVLYSPVVTTCSTSTVTVRGFRNKASAVVLIGNVDPDEVVPTGTTIHVMVGE